MPPFTHIHLHFTFTLVRGSYRTGLFVHAIHTPLPHVSAYARSACHSSQVTTAGCLLAVATVTHARGCYRGLRTTPLLRWIIRLIPFLRLPADSRLRYVGSAFALLRLLRLRLPVWFVTYTTLRIPFTYALYGCHTAYHRYVVRLRCHGWLVYVTFTRSAADCVPLHVPTRRLRWITTTVTRLVCYVVRSFGLPVVLYRYGYGCGCVTLPRALRLRLRAYVAVWLWLLPCHGLITLRWIHLPTPLFVLRRSVRSSRSATHIRCGCGWVYYVLVGSRLRVCCVYTAHAVGYVTPRLRHTAPPPHHTHTPAVTCAHTVRFTHCSYIPFLRYTHLRLRTDYVYSAYGCHTRSTRLPGSGYVLRYRLPHVVVHRRAFYRGCYGCGYRAVTVYYRFTVTVHTRTACGSRFVTCYRVRCTRLPTRLRGSLRGSHGLRWIHVYGSAHHVATTRSHTCGSAHTHLVYIYTLHTRTYSSFTVVVTVPRLPFVLPGLVVQFGLVTLVGYLQFTLPHGYLRLRSVTVAVTAHGCTVYTRTFGSVLLVYAPFIAGYTLIWFTAVVYTRFVALRTHTRLVYIRSTRSRSTVPVHAFYATRAVTHAVTPLVTRLPRWFTFTHAHAHATHRTRLVGLLHARLRLPARCTPVPHGLHGYTLYVYGWFTVGYWFRSTVPVNATHGSRLRCRGSRFAAFTRLLRFTYGLLRLGYVAVTGSTPTCQFAVTTFPFIPFARPFCSSLYVYRYHTHTFLVLPLVGYRAWFTRLFTPVGSPRWFVTRLVGLPLRRLRFVAGYIWLHGCCYIVTVRLPRSTPIAVYLPRFFIYPVVIRTSFWLVLVIRIPFTIACVHVTRYTTHVTTPFGSLRYVWFVAFAWTRSFRLPPRSHSYLALPTFVFYGCLRLLHTHTRGSSVLPVRGYVLRLRGLVRLRFATPHTCVLPVRSTVTVLPVHTSYTVLHLLRAFPPALRTRGYTRWLLPAGWLLPLRLVHIAVLVGGYAHVRLPGYAHRTQPHTPTRFYHVAHAFAGATFTRLLPPAAVAGSSRTARLLPRLHAVPGSVCLPVTVTDYCRLVLYIVHTRRCTTYALRAVTLPHTVLPLPRCVLRTRLLSAALRWLRTTYRLWVVYRFYRIHTCHCYLVTFGYRARLLRLVGWFTCCVIPFVRFPVRVRTYTRCCIRLYHVRTFDPRTTAGYTFGWFGLRTGYARLVTAFYLVRFGSVHAVCHVWLLPRLVGSTPLRVAAFTRLHATRLRLVYVRLLWFLLRYLFAVRLRSPVLYLLRFCLPLRFTVAHAFGLLPPRTRLRMVDLHYAYTQCGSSCLVATRLPRGLPHATAFVTRALLHATSSTVRTPHAYGLHAHVVTVARCLTRIRGSLRVDTHTPRCTVVYTAVAFTVTTLQLPRVWFVPAVTGSALLRLVVTVPCNFLAVHRTFAHGLRYALAFVTVTFLACCTRLLHTRCTTHVPTVGCRFATLLRSGLRLGCYILPVRLPAHLHTCLQLHVYTVGCAVPLGSHTFCLVTYVYHTGLFHTRICSHYRARIYLRLPVPRCVYYYTLPPTPLPRYRCRLLRVCVRLVAARWITHTLLRTRLLPLPFGSRSTHWLHAPRFTHLVWLPGCLLPRSACVPFYIAVCRGWFMRSTAGYYSSAFLRFICVLRSPAVLVLHRATRSWFWLRAAAVGYGSAAQLPTLPAQHIPHTHAAHALRLRLRYARTVRCCVHAYAVVRFTRVYCTRTTRLVPRYGCGYTYRFPFYAFGYAVYRTGCAAFHVVAVRFAAVYVHVVLPGLPFWFAFCYAVTVPFAHCAHGYHTFTLRLPRRTTPHSSPGSVLPAVTPPSPPALHAFTTVTFPTPGSRCLRFYRITFGSAVRVHFTRIPHPACLYRQFTGSVLTRSHARLVPFPARTRAYGSRLLTRFGYLTCRLRFTLPHCCHFGLPCLLRCPTFTAGCYRFGYHRTL